MGRKSGQRERGFRVRRVAAAIVSGGVFVFAAACSDSTGPTEVTPVTPPVTEAPVPAAMVAAAGDLDGMTSQFMTSLDDDATNQAKLAGALAGLKGHLTTGKILLAQQDVTAARGVIDSLDDSHQIELSPIGLALDVVLDVLSSLAN